MAGSKTVKGKGKGKAEPVVLTIKDVLNMLAHVEMECRLMRKVLGSLDPGTPLPVRPGKPHEYYVPPIWPKGSC